MLWELNDNVSFTFWQKLIIFRAVFCTVLVLVGQLIIFNHPATLTLVFRTLKIEANRFTSFQVPLFTNAFKDPDSRLYSSYLWTFRIGLLLFGILTWNFVVVTSLSKRISSPTVFNEVVLRCLRGWSCYQVEPRTFVSKPLPNVVNWLTWSVEGVCHRIKPSDNLSLYYELVNTEDKLKTISCFKLFPFTSMELVGNVVISLAAVTSIFVLFDVIVGFQLQRSSNRLFEARLNIQILTICLVFIVASLILVNLFLVYNPGEDTTIILGLIALFLFNCQRAAGALFKVRFYKEQESLAQIESEMFLKNLKNNSAHYVAHLADKDHEVVRKQAINSCECFRVRKDIGKGYKSASYDLDISPRIRRHTPSYDDSVYKPYNGIEGVEIGNDKINSSPESHFYSPLNYEKNVTCGRSDQYSSAN